MYSGWIYEHHPMITFAPTIARKLLHQTRFVTQFEVDEGARVDSMSVPSRMTRKILKHLSGASEVDWEFGTLLRDSDRVIVLSDNFAKKFLQLLPAVNEKMLLLPPPPLMQLSTGCAEVRESCRTRFGLKPDDFLLAYVGYVHHFKGIDVLLRALGLICKDRSNVRLIIIGGTEDDYTQRDGSYAKEMATLAEELGLSEKVIWTGKYASDTDFPSACLRSADACVLPFDTGVTLNRSSFAAAVAHGLPTITTKGVTLEPQFLDRRNVLLCPPKNPVALAAVINEVISSPEMQKTLSRGAFELANEWFSWTKTVRLTIAALTGPIQRPEV
jgi:glycosyltransferase involved in cell wall biosynthesis